MFTPCIYQGYMFKNLDFVNIWAVKPHYFMLLPILHLVCTRFPNNLKRNLPKGRFKEVILNVN